MDDVLPLRSMEQPESRSRAPRTSFHAAADSACIALISLLLAAVYLADLGFYSDDWNILAQFENDAARGQFGLASAWNGFEARPLHGLYLASLFALFGLQPLGYHLVNGAVIAASMPLFYLLLLRLKIDRRCAFAATVILIVLPQLSTVRVWPAAFQVPLSMLLALLSLHAQLTYVRKGKWWWAVAGALAAVASVAAYEIFAPFLILFPAALFIMHSRRQRARPEASQRSLAAILGLAGVLGLAILAKGLVTDRAQAPNLELYAKGLARLVQPDYDWRTSNSLNVFAALDVEFWQPLVGAAKGATAALYGNVDAPAIVVGFAVAALALWRLVATERGARKALEAKRTVVLGILVFLLGHATFLLTSQILFSPTGVGNRALVAAAPGVALIYAGLAAYLTSLVAQHRRPIVFAAVIAVASMLGSWRALEISRYWAEARSIQERVFESAGADLAELPPNAVVMVDGVCPYHGPAVILESWWDSSGWLSLALGRLVRADTSSNRMTIEAGGLRTSMYGEEGFYPFDGTLHVYDPLRHLVVPIPDRAAAAAYFSSSSERNTRCAEGYPGHGQLI